MKNLLGILALSVLATSCVELSGRLDVKEPFSVTRKSGFLNLGRKKMTVEPKLYNASIKILGRQDFNLKLESDTKIIIPVQASQELKFPENGEISISHRIIDQPFDVKGNVQTNYTSTDSQEAVEDCSVTLTENKCEKVCEPAVKDQAPKCAVVCRDVPVQFPGDRLVRFHYTTKTIILDMELLKANSESSLASFNGQDSDTYRVSEYEGRCFLKDRARMTWEERREWEDRERRNHRR
jgi:hypothetical protein